MITETIAYTDHDGNDRFDTLNFHISEAVLMDNLDLGDKLEEILTMSQEPSRMMTTEENQKMLDLLKRFMRLSYGVRLADGLFDQDDPAGSGDVWKKFRISSAYNAFLMSLFTPDPTRAAIFMYRVLPKGALTFDESEVDLNSLPPELRATLESELAKDKENQKPRRLAPGTRIVDDVPVSPALRSVPELGTDEDFDAMLAQAEAEESVPVVKKEITQNQHDLMKSKLKPEQFEKFMSTRYVRSEEPVSTE